MTFETGIGEYILQLPGSEGSILRCVLHSVSKSPHWGCSQWRPFNQHGPYWLFFFLCLTSPHFLPGVTSSGKSLHLILNFRSALKGPKLRHCLNISP